MSHSTKRLVAFTAVAVLKSLILLPVYQASDGIARAYYAAFAAEPFEPPRRAPLAQLALTLINGTVRFIVTFSLVLIAVGLSWLPLVGTVLYVAVLSWRMSFFFHSALWDLTPAGTSLHYKTMQIETNWAYHLGFGVLASTFIFILPTEAGDLLFGLGHPVLCLIAVSTQLSPLPPGDGSPLALPIFNLGNLAGDAVLAHMPKPVRAALAALE
ncbi:Etoposide-induced protein [Carpediemonas membranifera]|uniref:Etoposide-induced protein n=1 Tax=Carpediemonas membranifera TaxID=201153 RepID=A0A8J6BET0_9EUKA|nr:Etoposide-induced protein [Carpediemonas membranifera]|eukprot:KAG9395952.1 Etoposide-induced protein [Carpediemonas membranifera]